MTQRGAVLRCDRCAPETKLVFRGGKEICGGANVRRRSGRLFWPGVMLPLALNSQFVYVCVWAHRDATPRLWGFT